MSTLLDRHTAIRCPGSRYIYTPKRVAVMKMMHEAVVKAESCEKDKVNLEGKIVGVIGHRKGLVKRKPVPLPSIPLRERNVNYDDEDDGAESMDEADVVDLLQRLRTDSVRVAKKEREKSKRVIKKEKENTQPPPPPSRSSAPAADNNTLLAHALSRPAPPIPPRPRSPAPPPYQRPRTPSKYDRTLPKTSSPLATRSSSSSELGATCSSRRVYSITRRLLERSTPTQTPLLSATRNPHVKYHGCSKSSLMIVKALWEERYESWVLKRVSPHIRSAAPAFPNESTHPNPELNPLTFPRAGNISSLRQGQGTEIDWYFGACSLSSIGRTLYLFDLDQRLNRDGVGGAEWESDWEVRWQVLAAIFQKNQELAKEVERVE